MRRVCLLCLCFAVACQYVQGKEQIILAVSTLQPYIVVGDNCIGNLCPLSDTASDDTVFFGPLSNLRSRSPTLADAVNLSVWGARNEGEAAEALRNGTADVATPINSGFFVPHNGSISLVDFITTPIVLVWHPERIVDPFGLVLGALFDTWPYFIALFIGCTWVGFIMYHIDEASPDYQGATFWEKTWKGFWWAFVTATTVGYGDKTARNLEARVFAVMWIVAGVVLVAMLTGTFTNTLTSYSSMSPWDWMQQAQVSIGALQFTSSELACERGSMPTKTYASFE